MNNELDLPGMRVPYGTPATAGADGVAEHLDPAWLTGDPPWLDLFSRWLAEAVAAQIPEPNAMVLGTVDDEGVPATRTVLCKGADADGVVFFTGYSSAKGRALAANPLASVTFPWIAMERQVHFRGRVHKVDRAETEAYWNSRPRGSQLSGRASAQSEPIASRNDLESAAAAVAAEFGGADGVAPVPVPPEWGGYRLVPDRVEFWQGRADRLHNRALAQFVDGRWITRRLQP
ncbi:pyridoxine/pyridoxamine 5'-phosphate oxidase [Gordonia hirsuta DSM 44140 = NBRC 16056]|uniref:Pyridoxine/pyridoxamine 5'-phosphate oxidase n=1 Tax=Gordonia hirsuta DSM 44140 = NBRC 16056 TaxID=1121927 RepID=L7L8S6_9ACTN|nr:pyridoxamine 5'-phosphate oxidase [Gordonia hirsuta]GAC57530.1 pyridoxine/pyridoxamine 5'-phosphate oxidase [Gordonia hirsuta DSM 44140 = NBRC 16056]